MKRVLGRSRLAFGCYRHKLTQTEERGRERETIRKAPSQFKYSKYIEKRVCMHGSA